MPRSYTVGEQLMSSTIKRLLESITPSRLRDEAFISEVERQLEPYFVRKDFADLLMKADAIAWLAAVSVRKGHPLVFHCFCAWGMPIERVITLLMTLRPSSAVPMHWSKNYIDLFSDVCAYQWKAAPLAAQLVNFEGKETVPAVSLKILFRYAYRKKQLEDILLAMRVHMPEMNSRVEQALGWLLEDLSTQTQRLNGLPMELFAPHLFKASFLQAQSRPDVRQMLWGSQLSYESRISIGRLALAWWRCPTSEQCGWVSLSDIYNDLNQRLTNTGRQALINSLDEHSNFNAVIRCALIQEQVTHDKAVQVAGRELADILTECGYLEALLPDQRWHMTGLIPETENSRLNIGENINTVV